jgi:hypothetical protein
VLAFAAALDTGSSHFVWWQFVLRDVGLGFAFGLPCGLIGSVLKPRPGTSLADAPIPGHQTALYGLGVAFATYTARPCFLRGATASSPCSWRRWWGRSSSPGRWQSGSPSQEPG